MPDVRDGTRAGVKDRKRQRVSTVTVTVTPVSRSTDPAPLTFRVGRRRWPSFVVVVVYWLIGTAAFWSMLPGISDHSFGIDPDFTQAMWFMSWVPHAIGSGLNPLFSNAIYVPTGVNLMDSTASPLLGVLTAPFALVSSPVMRANLLLVSALLISATAGFLVFRRWQVWSPAAALGGAIYGFSPYMVGPGLEYVSLAFLPLPPLIALTVAYVGIHDRSDAFERASMAARPVGIALVTAAVLLAYPLWMMLAGPQHFTGPAWGIANPYHNDILNLVVPGPLQRTSFGMHALGSRLDSVIGPTAGGYVGIPLLTLAGIFAWRSRRILRMQLAAILMLCALVLSLSPYLAVNGRLTHFPLPFAVLDHVPLFDSILPFRISFAVDACLAAVIAFGLDDISGDPLPSRQDGIHRWRWFGELRFRAMGVILILLVATWLPQWPLRPLATRAATLPPKIRAAISYPYATLYDMQPMAWQANDGFGFRLLGGYGFRPGRTEERAWRRAP